VPRPGRQEVELPVDDLLDPRPQGLHAPDRELAEHLAPRRAVLGRVHRDQRRRAAGHLRAVAGEQRGEAGMGPVGAEPRIAEERADVLVPGDGPGRVAVAQRHPGDRRLIAEPLIFRGRGKRAAARGGDHQGGLGGHD
jgi:hypothetical protein